MKEGRGRFYWPDGKKFMGSFVNDKANGAGGILVWADGKTFKGSFKDNIREGFGKLKWKDGTILSAYYKNDRVIGNVMKTFTDGRKTYLGQVQEHEAFGKGVTVSK